MKKTLESRLPLFLPVFFVASHFQSFGFGRQAVGPIGPTREAEAHHPFKRQALASQTSPRPQGRTALAPPAGALGLGRAQLRATFK